MDIDSQMKSGLMGKSRFTSLFWRMAAVFFGLLVLMGLIYTFITIRSSEKYFDEINQQLNRNTAKNIVEYSTPFYDGQVIQPALEELFHNVMVINPALEVYLLDTTGKILAWYPPEKKLLQESIDLAPVRAFIDDPQLSSVKGDNPLQPNTQNVFSASRLWMNDKDYAYIYVVLSSEEYTAIAKKLSGNFLIKIGWQSMVLTLLATLGIGLIVIRILTNNLDKIISVMQQFRRGDLNARVQVRAAGDVGQVAVIFNEMADILTRNIEDLQKVEVLRRELIANVSHDLRTPISIIQGYVETMQMKSNKLSLDEQQQYLATIAESTRKLENLVSELFELSKLEANQIKPNKEPFFVSELISDMSSKYELLARDKNISISINLAKVQIPVYADIALIERVFQNLLDNAIKYTPFGGSIQINTNNKDQMVEVTVMDTGIGVPENERGQIFERYYKANNFTELKNSTGLGLAIVKKILDLHHASLELISKVGEGSAFIFHLPVHPSK